LINSYTEFQYSVRIHVHRVFIRGLGSSILEVLHELVNSDIFHQQKWRYMRKRKIILPNSIRFKTKRFTQWRNHLAQGLCEIY